VIPVVKEEYFDGCIGDVSLSILVSHLQTFQAKMDFDFCGRHYTMGVWLPNGINAAMYVFHQHYNPETNMVTCRCKRKSLTNKA
ncbi:hypothetical protein CEUSTIGMA_g14101.t1, partial [Chlamydomonas eustigma]